MTGWVGHLPMIELVRRGWFAGQCQSERLRVQHGWRFPLVEFRQVRVPLTPSMPGLAIGDFELGRGYGHALMCG
jgi:hypothetical protein